MQNEPAAQWIAIDKLTPWADNPRINDHAVEDVARSIQRFGFASPIIARTENNEVIAGHTRLKAAIKLGLDKVPVRFMDLDPADARMLALADNRVAELADWDDDALATILRELDADGLNLDGLGWEESSLDEILNGLAGGDRYTATIKSPIYEIKGERPDESELYDQSRSASLIDDIQDADIDPAAKSFLIAAAARHTVFQYDKVAEYYAHASADVQRLMEDSALVIIDFNKAIELGFVKLSKDIAAVYKADHG